ncbi:MAG: T9SS type A sorting domain-containing protein [Bacteroidales bacterium]|nr:T9SS type A sorting domain-containing protein [Bacteroidales bacterium]
MRKFTLLITFIVFSVFSFAQIANVPYVEKAANYDFEKISIPQNSDKGADVVFWEENFDSLEWSSYGMGEMPEGWTIYDGNGMYYYWRWSLEGPRGRYTSPDATADGGPDSFVPHPGRMNYDGTAANGFMMLEADYFNTGEDGIIVPSTVGMDSYFQIDSIDLSAAPGVTLQYKQMYRWCCGGNDKLSVFVAADYDPDYPENAHWAEYKTQINTGVNLYTFEEERTRKHDITSVAAGQQKVTIRFHMKDASHYFWIVDDIELIEPNTNDIVLDFSWFDYIYTHSTSAGADPNGAWNGGYVMIPAGQEAEFVEFRAAVSNFGLANQTNVVLNANIYKDDALIETKISPSKNIDVAQKDTLLIEPSWIPPGKGHYQVSTTVTMDLVDQDKSNNGYEYEFWVTDYTFSRSYDLDSYGATSSTNDWTGGGGEGDALAIFYDVPADAEVTSISLRISANDVNVDFIEAGDFGMLARLYTFDEAGEPTTAPIISSSYYTLQIADTSSWVTLDFLEDGVNQYITAGDYLATVEFYKGDGHADDRFRVSEDLTLPQPNYNMWIIQADGWGWVKSNACIRLNVGGTVTHDVTFNVDMNSAENFTAGTDIVYITGSMVGWTTPGDNEDYVMTDTDEDGIYTITLSMEAGDYQYKYFLNAGWDGGEWTGDPNRLFTVSADMTINDEFAVGIDELNINNLSMYPNPVNDVLNISNMINVDRIVVSNILGQEVRTFNNVNTDIEINTSELNKGVYIVTFIDKYNNASAKRFIKE